MKLTWRLTCGVYEVVFRSPSYVTCGYGVNRKQARDKVVQNIREHIEELNTALYEKDTWDAHER